MRLLLDTNVLSEVVKPRPSPRVIAWLRERSALDLAVSVLTLGEIESGVSRLPAGERRDALRRWLATDLVERFAGRILDVDQDVALAWGRLSSEGRMSGRELPVIDGLLLATAAVHRLTLVTRNVADCEGRGVEIFNPWTG